MSATRQVERRGVGFLTLLTLLFIALKLLGVIAWSWLWVLSPLWIPSVLVLVAAVIILVVYVLVGKKRGRR